jgi:hypothetical protein
LVTSSEDLFWIYNQFIDIICDPYINLFVITHSKKEFKKSQNQTTIKNLPKLFSKWIWMEYLSMYNNYLLYKSEKSEKNETGIIYCDTNHGQAKYIREIVKSFSLKFDKSSKLSGAGIVEDVIFLDSKSSYFIQLSDILATTIKKIVTGKLDGDKFEIKPEAVKKIKDKINKPNDLKYKKAPS